MPDSGFVLPPAFRVGTDAFEPVAGGRLEFFLAGTNDATNVYSDSTLSTSLGSVVYLDSGGHPVASSGSSTKVLVYTGSALIKIVAKDADGVTLATYDNVRCAQDTSALTGGGSDGGVETVVFEQQDYSVVAPADDGKLLNCNPTGSEITITLPSAATAGDGFEISIRHAGTTTTNVVKIATVASQTIARNAVTSATTTLRRGGEVIRLVSNGANWVAYGDNAGDFVESPIRITDRLTAPPSSPTTGARYIVNGTPTGEWASYAQHDVLEANGNGGWIRYRPYADCGWLAYVLDEDMLIQYRGTAWTDLEGVVSPATSVLKRSIFQERTDTGVNSAALTASAWTKRTINTTLLNQITGASLSSSSITLPAGTYLIVGFQTFYFAGAASTSASAKIRLSDAAGSILIYGGSSFHQNSNVNTDAEQFQIPFVNTISHTVETTYEFQYFQNYGTTSAGGVNVTSGSTPNVYAQIQIIDLSSLVGPQGEQGPQGNTGPGYYATSTTSLLIGTGTKSFTTQAGLAYQAGATVKAISAANASNYMIGLCTSYTGTTLTLNVTQTSGSGTLADWNIGLAGEQGPQGDAGLDNQDIDALTLLGHSALAVGDKVPVYDASAGTTKSIYADLSAIDPTNPEFGAVGDGVNNDTSALSAAATAAVAAKRPLRLRPGLVFLISNITFPANLVLQCSGAIIRANGSVTGNTAIVTLGADNVVDNLHVTTPGTTADRIVQLSSGCRFGSIRVVADSQVANTSDSLDGAVRVTDSNITGTSIYVENFDFAIAIASTLGAGSPISNVTISKCLSKNYVRGTYIRNATDVSVDLVKSVGASAAATTNPGHNGFLTASVQELTIGSVHVEDAGEHGVRVGGKNGSEQDTRDVWIGPVFAVRPGQCAMKVNCASPERFENVNTGHVTSIDCAATNVTGTNEDALRVEDVDGGTFGPVTALKNAKSNSCNDGIHIAYCNGVVIRPGSHIDTPARSGIYLDEVSDATTGLNANIAVGSAAIRAPGAAGVTISSPTSTIDNIVIDADIIDAGTHSWSVTANAVTAPCILRGSSTSPTTGHYTGSSDADIIKQYTVDGGTYIQNNVEDQTLSGGARITSKGLSTGNVTLDPGDRPIQHITNGGAFTITAPANDGYLSLLVTNNASAGSIQFSGFQASADVGDSLTTANGDDFIITVVRINGIATYHVKALQ